MSSSTMNPPPLNSAPFFAAFRAYLARLLREGAADNIQYARQLCADQKATLLLSGQSLKWANLVGIDLSGADLEQADLRWADLEQADLRGANLRGAALAGANLRGADLSEACLLDAELQGARYDEHTRWPRDVPSSLTEAFLLFEEAPDSAEPQRTSQGS